METTPSNVMDDLVRQSSKWADMPTTRTIWKDKQGNFHVKSLGDDHHLGQPMRAKDKENVTAQILALKSLTRLQ